MDSTKRKYESFEVADLVLNDDFKQLVSEKGNINLSRFIENPEGHEQNIRLASKIILGLQQKRQSQSLDLKYRLWRQVQNNHRRQKNFAILRYAAVLILCFSLGGGVLYRANQTPRIVELAKSNPVEYGQFELILPDGKTIFLTGSNPTVKSTNQGKTILINDSVRINQSSEGFNQLVVPYGHRGTVLLADGTQIRLNSGSRLVYPSQFSENKREVYLEGEGLFKVKRSNDKPFYVQTGKFEVQVLGTTFNVQAYGNENLFNTLLVEGKVNLKLNKGLFPASVELLPNQMASLTENHDEIRLESIGNIQNYTSWASGYLEFNNENIELLLKKIAMYYNIQVDLRGDVRQLKINGKLDLTDNPESIIAGVAAMGKMNYKKEGDNFILYQ
ncbi:MAG: hypothetical protein A2W90_18945 [Bacteroidetes bacterium GWF2_42_66]|nr:MAG: hypothetical protein A2W92_05750 [Bacteroidetes bacterium GWA2_42_15]OFX98752.1 MAG: hypothetical protein A2W89_10750 [Bacteroidetes bacterium GWE2_42_39]OFY43051.1 MAG: hypothetical protein A2W90_18945 [Bacteroidetes bacterium GWF2_42_66]HAZ02806.1 hypothetical protein [Marinilabiliales bacterium]HBL77108.1 hypothetical protein [Prolixibacteraceae bacterium]